MLEIDYGLAGSGKSRYIKNTFAGKLESGEKLMILVPDQHSFITERSVLEDFGVQNGSKIKVVWFHHLASLITEQYGGVRPVLLENAGKAILMSKAVSQLQEELVYYKKQASKPDFIAGMLNISTELKYAKTDTQTLLSAAEHGASPLLGRKLAEIARIADRYDALVGESYLNPDDMLTKVNELLQQHNFFEGYTVAIDGFGFFDKQKIDVIERIIAQSRQTYITLCTDSLELRDDASDKFDTVKKTAVKLIAAARAAGKDVKTKHFDDLSAMKPAFQALSRGIYVPASAKYEEPVKEVRIVACDNMAAECESAALSIKKLIMSGQYRYKDIAVIVRDEQAYLPQLKSAFRALEIPFFRDERRAVNHEPLMLFCYFALKAAADHFRLDDVMNCIKSAAAGMDMQEISAFENYCIVWNINGRKKWSADFTYNPRGFTERFEPEDEQALERINLTRRKIIIPLLQFAAAMRGATVKGMCTALFELLERVDAAKHMRALIDCTDTPQGDIAREQSAVWQVLTDALDRLVATRGDETLSIKEFMQILNLAVSASNIGVLPGRMDEILVGSADRIRTDMPKAAFLLGVSDGDFPLAYADSGILSDADRMQLLSQGIELGVNCRSMTSQERFFAYCAALAPGDYLYLSYPISDYDGGVKTPSSLIKEICRILPAIEIEAFQIGADDILTPAQGFAVLTRLWKTDSPLRATLYEIYCSMEPYASKIRLIEQNTQAVQMRIDDPETARKLFGAAMEISPTRLETFSKCPFMYFCKYGLRANTRERAALDARTGGTLIHYVLEHLLKDIGKQGVILLSESEISDMTDKYIAAYLEELNLPEEFITGRFRYIVSKNRAIIISTIEQMAEEMKQSDFEPTDFELKVGKREIGGYEVPLKNGSVSLTGTVDRVDVMEKDGKKYFRIIDYKTGSKDFRLGEVLYGINAQMLIYLLSLANDSGEKYGGSIPAGLLYINAADKPIAASHDAPLELAKHKRERYHMNGMVLDDTAVITGMEHEPSGKFIPIKVSGKGVISGNLVSAHQMEKIRERLDAVVTEMGEKLHAGEIDDMPFAAGGSLACDWCDFKAVCRNREKKKEVNIPSFEEALKQVEGGEEHE